MYKEHDLLVLRHDFRALHLVGDDIGAVVGVYRAGGSEVEFAGPEGETFEQVFSPQL